MKAYQRGLFAGAVVVPDHPLFHRAGVVRDGAGLVLQSGSRFYSRGISGRVAVGAQTSGPIGTLADGVVNLFLDIAHVFLLFAGLYAVWTGLHG